MNDGADRGQLGETTLTFSMHRLKAELRNTAFIRILISLQHKWNYVRELGATQTKH